jgi:hypothetical protein
MEMTGGARRIACIWWPRLGLRVAARRDPLVRGRAPAAHAARATGDTPPGVALFRPGTRWQELLQCSADLEVAGIIPGTPLKEAQARYPDARYLPCDDETLAAIGKAFTATVAALAPYSPAIEPALGVVPGLSGRAGEGPPPGVIVDPARAVAFLDVAGLEARYGPEVDLAAHLAATATEVAARASAEVASSVGASPSGGANDAWDGALPVVAVGIAEGKFGAWVAAATALARADAAARAGASSVEAPRRLRWREIAGPDTLTPDLPTPDRDTSPARGTRPVRGRARPVPLPSDGPAVAMSGAAAPPAPVLVVPPGGIVGFLDDLPLATLPLAMGVRRALERLGIRTLGRFAALPANAVIARYGAAARHAHRLASGHDDEPLRPPPPPLAARVTVAFEWEETDLDRLTFILRSLAGQLVARLHALGRPDGVETDHDPDVASDPGFDPTAPDPLPPDDDLSAEGDAPELVATHPDMFDDSVSYQRSAMQGDVDKFGNLDDEAGRAHVAAMRRRVAAFETVRARANAPTRATEGARPKPSERPRRVVPAEAPAPYAVEALRVTWLLAPRRGEAAPERREVLLRLAEPTATGHAFATHLRWHVEGLDRLLADASDVDGADTTGTPGDLTYAPMADRRRGVVGIDVEAAGIGAPVANQMALHLVTGSRPAWARAARDPERQVRAARLALARLQARWGEDAVGGLPVADPAARLPEHARDWGPPVVAFPSMLASPLAPPAPSSGATRHGLEAAAPFWLIDPPRPIALRRLATKRLFLDLAPPNPLGASGLNHDASVGLPFGDARGLVAVGRVTGPWHLVDPTTLVDIDPPRRDYFQVETDDQRVLLLYRDRASSASPGAPSAPAWFLQGVYD